MKRIFKEALCEKGAAPIIEMTLIFPFVLVIVMFLLYIGSYILQGVSIYNDAQRIALIAAHEAQMPGYEEFFNEGGITTKADFNWSDSYVPGKTVINSIMKVHDPYRYWGTSFLKSSNKATLEEALRDLIEKGSFLAKSDVECNIQADNLFLVQRIKVNVVKKVSLPGMFRLLGLDGAYDIDVTAIAVVNDSSNFIRNTDIVFDLGGYLWNDLKFGDNNQTMSQRASILKQKFIDAKAKMGW